ncbi:glycosyltransferase family protein [Clostridium nigeriense]|uniref:hypothetical protein n=1 Tax=Clostridium nigeriense TaxID=1805470 RepID=UPI00083143BC|nr:hypothetical protein [Clostridium nigeriense]
MKKNVLFIAYHFPPIGGSGVQRSLKYVKYLPSNGYNPIVATVKEGHNFAYDYGMLKEIPENVKVYRSNSGEMLWLREIIEKVNEFLSKLRTSSKEEVVEENKGNSENKDTIKDKIFRYLEYNYYVPDTKIRWYKHAIRNIKNIILKENKIDVIYSTSAPYTDHLIAMEIKKKTNKPWVADFRDPWIGNDSIMGRYSEKRIKKEKEMELQVVTLADIVINVTDPITEMYKKRYPQFKNKFITITNGFDGGDKDSIKRYNNTKFKISYAGLLDSSRTPKSLIIALENIFSKNQELAKDLVVDFTGYVSDDLINMINNSKISKNINVNSYVEHKEILNIMANSNINLIILPDIEESKGVFTGKIFDYILAERPILGIMPDDGVAAKLINENNIGLAVNHNDIDKIEEFILEEYKKFKSGYDLNTDSIGKCSQYDRRNLTKQLVEVFNKLT